MNISKSTCKIELKNLYMHGFKTILIPFSINFLKSTHLKVLFAYFIFVDSSLVESRLHSETFESSFSDCSFVELQCSSLEEYLAFTRCFTCVC